MSTLVVAEWRQQIEDLRLPPAVSAVAGVLANHYDRSRGVTHPGIRGILASIAVSERTIVRALNVLRELKVIERGYRGDRFRGLADEYRLVMVHRRERQARPPKRPAMPRSNAISAHPSKNGTTGSRTRLLTPEITDAVTSVHALGARERQRLQDRAERMVASGAAVDVVVMALTARLPENTLHAAAVLHARLLNIDGLPVDDAVSWVGSLRERVRRVGRRRKPRVAPRVAADFGAVSTASDRW